MKPSSGNKKTNKQKRREKGVRARALRLRTSTRIKEKKERKWRRIRTGKKGGGKRTYLPVSRLVLIIRYRHLQEAHLLAIADFSKSTQSQSGTDIKEYSDMSIEQNDARRWCTYAQDESPRPRAPPRGRTAQMNEDSARTCFSQSSGSSSSCLSPVDSKVSAESSYCKDKS
jgi:hypothetical protein